MDEWDADERIIKYIDLHYNSYVGIIALEVAYTTNQDEEEFLQDEQDIDILYIGRNIADSVTQRFNFTVDSQFSGFYTQIPKGAFQNRFDFIPGLGVIYSNCTDITLEDENTTTPTDKN